MGLGMEEIYAEIELVRGDDLILCQEGYLQEDQVRKIRIQALVQRHSSMLVIPESIQHILDLRKLDERQVELAGGAIALLDVVGPVEVRFENRQTFVEAMVLPDGKEVLLGAIPLLSMDVLIDPKRERLIVNPESPDVARMLLK